MKALLLSMTASLFLLAYAGAGDDAALKKDLAAIKGTWKIASFESENGKKDDFEGATLTFTAEKIEFKKGDETKKGAFKLNPAGKPKEIDLKPEDKNEDMPGIYHLDGDTLKLCVSDGPNAARPTVFEPKGRAVVITLKREK